jgi:hypothetical protein
VYAGQPPISPSLPSKDDLVSYKIIILGGMQGKKKEHRFNHVSSKKEKSKQCKFRAQMKIKISSNPSTLPFFNPKDSQPLYQRKN